MNTKPIKLFLRFVLSIGFLSAVADRFGWWGKENSVWGNWKNFLDYTQSINPWMPISAILWVGILTNGAEIILALFLFIGFKTESSARLSGWLLLIFALAMSFSTGIKSALDFSVYSASAGAFALGTIKEKYFEIDTVLK